MESRALNTTNLTSNRGIDLLYAYASVMKSNITGLNSEIKIAPGISVPLHISKEEIAETFAQMVEMKNQTLGIYEVKLAISNAINGESFGQFSCAKDRSEMWSVNILPLILERQPGVITNNPFYMMYIGVVPLKSGKN